MKRTRTVEHPHLQLHIGHHTRIDVYRHIHSCSADEFNDFVVFIRSTRATPNPYNPKTSILRFMGSA